MKPSKSSLYVAVFLSLIVSQYLVAGQVGLYNSFGPRINPNPISRFLPLLVGCGVGYILGKFLACNHCHSCSEENDNTAADCTDEEGCELVTQPTGVAPNNVICTCTDDVLDIFK